MGWINHQKWVVYCYTNINEHVSTIDIVVFYCQIIWLVQRFLLFTPKNNTAPAAARLQFLWTPQAGENLVGGETTGIIPGSTGE